MMKHAVELSKTVYFQGLSSSSAILFFNHVCAAGAVSTRRDWIWQNIERSLKFETKKKQHQAPVMSICR